MAHEAATTSTGENRRVTRFGRWIQSEFTGMFHWLSFKKGLLSADESGELMRRYMTHKSWFDRTSSWWVEQPVLIKATYVVGFSVLSAIFGLFVGAPLLLGLLATVTSITIHALFVSHEKSRLEGASVFAKETIALNEQLKASQAFFRETTNELRTAVDEFHEQGVQMEEGVTLLEADIEKVQQANRELISIIEDAERETTQIIIQEKAVTTHLESMSDDLEKCEQALVHTTEKIEGLGETLSRLSTTTCEMQTSQKGFSEAVNRFSLFVNSLPPKNTEYINDETDEFIDSLRQQNDEDEQLIREMQLLMVR